MWRHGHIDFQFLDIVLVLPKGGWVQFLDIVLVLPKGGWGPRADFCCVFLPFAILYPPPVLKLPRLQPLGIVYMATCLISTGPTHVLHSAYMSKGER